MKNKYYWNGTLVRTSDHEYTYGVADLKKGEIIACRGSQDKAVSFISTEVSRLSKGIENCKRAITALKNGKSYYMCKEGRRSYPIPFDHTDTEERYLNGIEWREAEIAYIHENLRAVPLEKH